MAKNIQRTLGARIRTLRKDRKWSQEDLAAAADLHWTYIGQVERGERNLTLASMQSISKALGLKVSELTQGVD
ncbi:MAG TPA: helix-turn-helix transcriptional regulator [Acidobacteriaceae bacterium]|nr:helix-turn-helix transcriptional regulator [Acidobacteriaceae bacterium]